MRKPHPAARILRRQMPDAERLLWVRIKNRALGEFRFRRQHTIGRFVVDFVCVEARLAVELDGEQHGRGDAPTRDAARDAFIEAAGFRVLRFWNGEVRSNIDGVLTTILHAAEEGRLRQSLRG